MCAGADRRRGPPGDPQCQSAGASWTSWSPHAPTGAAVGWTSPRGRREELGGSLRMDRGEELTAATLDLPAPADRGVPGRREGPPAARAVLLLLALACGGLAAAQVRERERKVEARGRAAGRRGGRGAGHRSRRSSAARRSGRSAGARSVTCRRTPRRAGSPRGRARGGRGSAGSYLTVGVVQGAGPAEPVGRCGRASAPSRSPLRAARRWPGRVRARSWTSWCPPSARREQAGRLWRSRRWRCSSCAHRARPASPAEDSADVPAATALATLRVSLRQAVYLAAAENFGHEVRLLMRPPGDEQRARGFSVGRGSSEPPAAPADALDPFHPAVRPAQQRSLGQPDEQAVLDHPGDLLQARAQRIELKVGRQRAVEDEMALVGQVGLAVLAPRAGWRRVARRPDAGACHARRSAPPPRGGGNARQDARPSSASLPPPRTAARPR